jgi:hypothetical protein
MGECMVSKLKCKFLAILLFVVTGCFTPSIDSDWTIEWTFKSMIDSLPLFANDSFSIENSLSKFVEKGNVDSIGRILISLGMPGLTGDVISINPNLQCKIYKNGNMLFDSTFYWEDLEFKKQYSDYFGKEFVNVSKKTFYR